MKHTLKLIYRNFRKNLPVNLINLGGLSLSMAVVLMLSAYCFIELSTDTHHPNADHTFLITSKDGDNLLSVHTAGVLSGQLKEYLPQIDKVVRMSDAWNPPIVKTENGENFESNLVFTENGFFDLFKFPALRGNLEMALSQPTSVILTSTEASRLFGSIDVIGKTLLINNEHLVSVQGVVDDTQGQSFLNLKMILPISAMDVLQPSEGRFTEWTHWDFLTFVQFSDLRNLDNVALTIEKIIEEHSKGKTNFEGFSILPIKSIYFSPIDNAGKDFFLLGDQTKVVVLLMVALLILLMAVVNYMNISAFNLQERLPQTGIFKILGAGRREILKHSIFESVLMFVVAMWLAIILAEVMYPMVHYFTGMAYPDQFLLSLHSLGLSLATAIFLGAIINIIPAIKQSGSHPIANLKKDTRIKTRTFQGSLVIFQFCTAIVLISFTFLVHQQIRFGMSDLGFRDDNIIAISMTNQLKKEVLEEKLNSLANVRNISFSRFYPGKSPSSWKTYALDQGKEKMVAFSNIDADYRLAKLVGLEITSGRFFSDSLLTDKDMVVINEAFVRAHQIEDPLQLTILNSGQGKFKVIGVVKDFHYQAKNHAIGPLVIFNRGFASNCFVEINSQDFKDLTNTVSTIKNISNELSPDFPVEVSFLDDTVEDMYQAETQFQRTFTFFSSCAILISSLGILALSLFTIQRKTKEIGIRKVNGAHIENILVMLNKDFAKWVMIAMVVATPISYLMMQKWLQGFAYKTEISWWIFATGGLSALAIALLTVSWQSWKAARRNPVEALRYE